MKGVEEIQRAPDEVLIKRKAQATEGERLRSAYSSLLKLHFQCSLLIFCFLVFCCCWR
jgi:hypothetical protein